jgi:hypothetical protein
VYELLDTNIILLRIFPLENIHEKCLANENDKFQKSLSRPSIIDPRAHYWAAARILRSIGLDNRLIDGGKVVSPTHPQYVTPQKHFFLCFRYRPREPQEGLGKLKISPHQVST